MDSYIFFGAINTLFIFVSLLGVFSQLRKIWQRKANDVTKNNASELLSLNQFSVSFLAYFSFFVYGYSIEPFNHFIVWPRLIASIIVAAILLEIWKDRKNKASFYCLSAAAFILILGTLGLMSSGLSYLAINSDSGTFANLNIAASIHDESKILATTLIVSVTLMIAQGYFHQIMLIIRSGKTGAVDLKMSQFILMMDISTIAFALTMSLENGWPLLMLAVVSGITKIVIMFLFYWVRVSKTAKARRTQSLVTS